MDILSLNLLPFLILFVLSIIQSLFGIGILLFGTPLLLSFGYQYEEVLLFLLPASAAISWSQVWDFRHEKLDQSYRKAFFIFSFPSLFLGILLSSSLNLNYEIKIVIILMLTLTLILRIRVSYFEHLKKLIRNNLRKSLVLMGFIHGLSNMGGSILTPIVSSLYSKKDKVITGVSFSYAFMASFQIIILLFIGKHGFKLHHLWCPLISLATRYTLGKKVYSFTSEKTYVWLINIFIFINAVLMVIKL